MAEKTPSNRIRHRPRQQAEQDAEGRHDDGDGDGEFQESLFGGGILHADRLG